VQVANELNDVLILLSSDTRVHCVIYIVVVDILEDYAIVLSRDWSKNIQGYFSIDWSHLWLPTNEKMIR